MENVSSLNANISRENNTNFEGTGIIIATVEKYAVPIICIFGLVGNTLSFIVFVQRALRRKSCSIFLAARSLSDNGFLITLLIIWTSSVFDLGLSRIVGICQVIVLFTYVFGCLSVWLVVFVTIENYIRICKPFMVNSLCQTTKAKYAVITLLICALCCYNFPLWTMTEECTPKSKHFKFLRIMVYVDSILTLVFPLIIMSFLLSRITMSSLSSCKQRRRTSLASGNRISDLKTKVTTMLLAVTLIFITLNLPLHVVRIRLLVISFVKDKIDVSTPLDIIIQSISQLIYYLSLAINFVVYFSFGTSYRRTFIGLFTSRKKNVYSQTDCSTLLTTRTRKIGQSHQSPNGLNNYCNNISPVKDIQTETRIK